MRAYSPELLQPVFDFLDGIIRDYGDILFTLFTYAAIPFLVWVLCGGLRRKLMAGISAPDVSPFTVSYLPLAPPRPRPEPLPPFDRAGLRAAWLRPRGRLPLGLNIVLPEATLTDCTGRIRLNLHLLAHYSLVRARGLA